MNLKLVDGKLNTAEVYLGLAEEEMEDAKSLGLLDARLGYFTSSIATARHWIGVIRNDIQSKEHHGQTPQRETNDSASRADNPSGVDWPCDFGGHADDRTG